MEQVSISSFSSDIHTHTSAKIRRERQTVEMLTSGTFCHRVHVEIDEQQRKRNSRYSKTDEDDYESFNTIQIGDMRQQREREKKSKNEPRDVCIVVNPRQQAERQEHEQDGGQLGKWVTRFG